MIYVSGSLDEWPEHVIEFVECIFALMERRHDNNGNINNLARLYESTSSAIALTTASALALAWGLPSHKILKFWVKVFRSLYLLSL